MIWLTLPLLAGCNGFTPIVEGCETVECSNAAFLVVQDSVGSTLIADAVYYTINDGALETATCFDTDCDMWNLDFLVGTYEISADVGGADITDIFEVTEEWPPYNAASCCRSFTLELRQAAGR